MSPDDGGIEMDRQTQINEIVRSDDYLHSVVHSNPGPLSVDSRIVRDQVNHILGQGFVELSPAGPVLLRESREALRAYRG